MEDIKKFELNTKILKNFDDIMSMKLDKVEELKITELDNGSKLINIVSLCANLKTLIVEGDQRINSDRIIRNIFKADTLENLVLNNVKLPKTTSLKKCKNLRKISLNSIRGFDIKDFLQNGIINKRNLDTLSISNSDMLNASIEFLKEFSELKNLELNNLLNCKFENLSFIQTNNRLLKLTLKNNDLPIEEINNIVKFNGLRYIDIITKNDGKIIKFRVNEKNISEIDLLGDNIANIAKNINLYRINKFNIFIENGIDDFETIKNLNECKKNIKIILKNYSSLSIEQAEIIKDYLEIYNLQTIDNKEITIDKYMENKKQVSEIIKIVNYSDNEIQKFLKVYKLLGQKLEITQNKVSPSKIKCNKNDVAHLLQRCLECVNIESNVIFGDDLENKKEHYWNQVKIDNKWYNVDLGLDIQNLKKKKTEYCLLDDEDFSETHNAKSGEKHYCPEEYNYKFVNVYIKTGLFKTQLLASYIEIMKLKFKKIFNSNKKEKILALQSGEKDK